VSWAIAGYRWWPGRGSDRQPPDLQSDHGADGVDMPTADRAAYPTGPGSEKAATLPRSRGWRPCWAAGPCTTQQPSATAGTAWRGSGRRDHPPAIPSAPIVQAGHPASRVLRIALRATACGPPLTPDGPPRGWQRRGNGRSVGNSLASARADTIMGRRWAVRDRRRTRTPDAVVTPFPTAPTARGT
jgi:hypothetical protein